MPLVRESVASQASLLVVVIAWVAVSLWDDCFQSCYFSTYYLVYCNEPAALAEFTVDYTYMLNDKGIPTTVVITITASFQLGVGR